MLLVYGLPMVALVNCLTRIGGVDFGPLAFLILIAEAVGLVWFARRIWRTSLRTEDCPFRLDWSLEGGLLFLCAGWLLVFLTLLWTSKFGSLPSDTFGSVIITGYIYIGVMVLGWIWVVIALCAPLEREK